VDLETTDGVFIRINLLRLGKPSPVLLFPKLNKPSFAFSHRSSFLNFFIVLALFSTFSILLKVQHPKPDAVLAIQLLLSPASLVHTLQERMCPFFSLFSHFFPIVGYSICGSVQAPGLFLEYPISVMKLRGILNTFLGRGTAEVCDTVEMKVKNLYLVQHKGTYVIFFISVNSL